MSNTCPGNSVIDNARAVEESQKKDLALKPGAYPASFRDWANDLREAQSVKSFDRGGGGFRGGAHWWRRLDKPLRCYVLCQVDGDDWERYLDAPWSAIPVPVRSAIASQSRAIVRALEGCPWR